MMLYQRGRTIDPGKLNVRLHPDAGFAMIDILDDAAIFMKTPADCDALIIAATEAKRLLDPPVITDSERTCNEVNGGEHCTRGGDHGVHRDSNGDEWRTDGKATAIEPRSGCECGHSGTAHFLDLLRGGDLTYCHVCDCIAYVYVQVVNA